MQFVLIIMMHVGPLGSGNSNAITTQEFFTEQSCIAAGYAAEKLAQGTVRQIKTVCVKK